MKKGLAAVIIIVVAVAIVVAVVRFLPGAKTRPPAPPAVTVQPKAAAPMEVVTNYLTALEARDCRSAYELLSRESKAAHPYDEFVKLNEKGVTAFDLATAKQEPKGKDMMVVVNLREDPSDHGFHLVQEGGEWRVVFIKGVPSFPYAAEQP
jgi:hypothetical protein